MTTELVPIKPPEIPARIEAELLTAFLTSLKPRTQKEYAGDLKHFARFLGVSTAALAVDHLLTVNGVAANELVHQYRTAMDNRGLSTATIARRLSTLRSVTRFARTRGRVVWPIEIRSLRLEKRRDVQGPDLSGWKKLWLAAIAAGTGRRARRDRALISLLYDLALRCGEALALDLADVDLEAGTVAVVSKGKGGGERERLTLPDIARQAVAEWIEVRGDWQGPLFTRSDCDGPRGRLTGSAVRLIVAGLGRAAGLKKPTRPHGLRHSAINRALELGFPLQAVRLFSRHAKTETVLRSIHAWADAAAISLR